MVDEVEGSLEDEGSRRPRTTYAAQFSLLRNGQFDPADRIFELAQVAFRRGHARVRCLSRLWTKIVGTGSLG